MPLNKPQQPSHVSIMCLLGQLTSPINRPIFKSKLQVYLNMLISLKWLENFNRQLPTHVQGTYGQLSNLAPRHCPWCPDSRMARMSVPCPGPAHVLVPWQRFCLAQLANGVWFSMTLPLFNT